MSTSQIKHPVGNNNDMYKEFIRANMLPELLVVDMIMSAYEFISQSKLLMYGIALVGISLVLSALSGLIDIAVYLATIGGVALLAIGGLSIYAPGLVPFIAM